MVVLCELVDELVVAVREQSTLLRAVMVRVAANTVGQNRSAGHQAGAAAPGGTAEGDDKGGAPVQLREPGVPPPDPDEAPAEPAGRPVAGPPTETAAPRRQPASKTTKAKTTTAKTPPAAREGRRTT